MKKVLAFAGSTSSTSINKKLVTFAAHQLQNTIFDIIDLRDFNAPIYSIDEEQKGFPEDIIKLNESFKKYDGFIISLAEHNGSYTAAFKNIFDWITRVDKVVYKNKPMLLMATAPGPRGGLSVLEAAKDRFIRMGALSIIDFSLPQFHQNFGDGKVTNQEYEKVLLEKIALFEKQI